MLGLFSFMKETEKETEKETRLARKFHESLRVTWEERHDYYSRLSYNEKDIYLRKGGVPCSFPIPISGKYYKHSQSLLKQIKLFREGFMLETGIECEQSVSSKIKSVNLLYGSGEKNKLFRGVWKKHYVEDALEEYLRNERINDGCFTEYDLECETEFEENKYMVTEKDRNGEIKMYLC